MQLQSKRSGEAAAFPTNSISHLFKPRQVLLNSLSTMKNIIQNNGINQTKTPISLSTQQRTLLLQSICQFLELNGFSKTLKNFRKELDFEKDSWKSCLLNLEEMCYHYLKMRDDTKVSDSAIKEQAPCNETTENEGDKEKNPDEKTENDSVEGKKKKKKSKKASDLSEETIEENPVVVPVSVPSEPEKKSKGKKKKHKDDSQEEKKDGIQVKSDELPEEKTSEKLDAVSVEEKKEKSKSRKKKEGIVEDAVEPAEVVTEKKSSKKRKKFSSEENDTGCVENATVEDSKRRKTDNLEQSNGTILPKTPNGSANGVLEKDEKQESQKSKKWQEDGSTEPRTAANAFRRVREEEVEFVDEKLQDNSYWAKDGADSGYGAKAQEVLGQVRGRDFRHEKTKKKRGSYRGGQIDLHSHSFKFNYDDEEE